MKLYKLTISNKDNDFHIKQKCFDVKITKKTFVSDKFTLHKSKLMVVDSLLLNNIKNEKPLISYHIYCKVDYIDEATNVLKQHFKNRLLTLQKGYQTLEKIIDKL